MRATIFPLSVLVAVAGATPYHRNLAFRSPFATHPELGHNVDSLTTRLHKRQTVSSQGFIDEHYVLYGGADFHNAPLIWSGGISFTHGVASGDPFSDSVLLWTRAAPAGANEVGPDQSVPICASFKVWDNAELEGHPVDSGEAFTSVDVDWTLKVEATNLRPDTFYWYQFADCTNTRTTSIVGRTRTFADPNTPAEEVNGGKPLNFAVFSCSNYPAGFFNAYTVAATNLSVDAWLHLGDYIYEYADGVFGNGSEIGRPVPHTELALMHDYRTRIALYRTDVGLHALHQNVPLITVWDDHDVADNTWKAGSTDSNDSVATGGCSFNPSGACFTDRKSAGVRAYHEWMPIRQVDADDKLRIWRNFQIGKLLDLTMLDTRQYNRDVTDDTWNHDFVETLVNDTERSMMGPNQESWFESTLLASQSRGALWRVIGQQVVFSQLLFGTFFDIDAWDGYIQNRNRVLNAIKQHSISNAIILSGDSHANWVTDLAFPNDTTTYNPTTGNGALGVEFAGTAVSSPSSFGAGIAPAAANVISSELLPINPELQWSEGSFRGFFLLTVSTKNVTASYWAMQNITTANTDAFVSAQFIVLPGENKLHRPVAGGSVAAGVLKK